MFYFIFYSLKPFYILQAPPERKCSKCFSKGMLQAVFKTLNFYMSRAFGKFSLSISLDCVTNMEERDIFSIYLRKCEKSSIKDFDGALES